MTEILHNEYLSLSVGFLLVCFYGHEAWAVVQKRARWLTQYIKKMLTLLWNSVNRGFSALATVFFLCVGVAPALYYALHLIELIDRSYNP